VSLLLGQRRHQVELDDLLRDSERGEKDRPDLNGHRLVLRVNPEIARAFKEEESAVLRDLRQSIGRDVTVKPDVRLHHEQFDVMAV